MLIPQMCFLRSFVLEVMFAYKINVFLFPLTINTIFVYKVKIHPAFPVFFWSVRPVGWDGKGGMGQVGQNLGNKQGNRKHIYCISKFGFYCLKDRKHMYFVSNSCSQNTKTLYKYFHIQCNEILRTLLVL